MTAASRSPERWLASLDPIGWRLGLDRIRALLGELGEPQRAFRAAHVVGTNGKSSVVALAVAVLEAHGHRAGGYLSPHADRWAQRISIGGEEVAADAFAAAVERVAAAVERVERRLAGGERVTQFEAATATAFVALAAAGVEIAVVEAGLGGRLDATNVLDSEVTALTSVGLDHTEWLGETALEIAAEKLAVLRPGTRLVVGVLDDEVLELARRTARELGCELVVAAPANVPFAAPYLARNASVALEVARALVGPLDDAAVAGALSGLRLEGRAELLDGDPPVVLDAAHNPDGAAALRESLAALASGPVVACLAVLADKDADGIVAALAPAIAEAVCCEIAAEDLRGSGRPSAASHPASALAAACERHGLAARALADPAAAVEAAVARAHGLGGTALICGSHYLLRYRWIARRAQSCSR